MDREKTLKRLQFRSWHRGTREADAIIGGFFDKYGATWTDEEIIWFENLLEHDDVDVMAWAIGTQPIPDQLQGPQMECMKQLDFVDPYK
ncbi:succinate dehydrogenase assembly factor 2 [Parasphingorhabdus halotolerans]|uniref:FAD assembly factor SdhE n=1 Tax=Parasphingorhabdus halotolerans TaxID=2725558 RepID=A0A6H2DIZ8_9SPHN|nr:succinate dehydrogenase assembly factor 2 [Parasphingorhabdus halotolerans]QJB68168.1 succinate dehydrogenase assembly factor 2 [Parasphingorhabdus halotolerans]